MNEQEIQDVLDELNEVTIKQCELDKKDKIINEIRDYFQSGLSMCEDCENWLDNEHCKKMFKGTLHK